MQHNHNPDATWETALVIPEAVKSVEDRTLDALLRIEERLSSVLAVLRHSAKAQDPAFGTPVKTEKEPVDLAEVIGDLGKPTKKAKAK